MEALIIPVRLPNGGRVKPRLAAKVTKKLATKFYRACAEHVILESAKCEFEGVVRYMFYSDGSVEQAQEWMRSIHQNSVHLQPQATWTDAGGRICDAFGALFAAGAAAVILISVDVPDFDVNLISKAFTALEYSDVVFGPTHDGGYYLIGLKSHKPSLFEAIHWGTNEVLQMSVNKAKQLGLVVAPLAVLPRLHDIDTVDSMREWMSLPSSKTNSLCAIAAMLLDESQRVSEALAETGYALLSA